MSVPIRDVRESIFTGLLNRWRACIDKKEKRVWIDTADRRRNIKRNKNGKRFVGI